MKLSKRRPAVPYPAAWQRLGTQGHSLGDPAGSRALTGRADEIQAAFGGIGALHAVEKPAPMTADATVESHP